MITKQQTNPVKAIRQKCLDCCGGNQSEVKQCPVTDCALYPFRFGKNPYRKKVTRTYTVEERRAMAERFARNLGRKTGEPVETLYDDEWAKLTGKETDANGHAEHTAIGAAEQTVDATAAE